MQIKITRNKKKSKLPELFKKVAKLNQQKASIGYFQDSGIHTLADMNYATLAFIHEFPTLGKHPKRPVIGQMKPIKGESDNKAYFKSLLQDYIRIGSKYTVDDVLTSIGRKYVQKGKYIMGNAAYLVVTNNPTPLYDTGELSDNMGYKTTMNYTLRYT